MNTAKKVAILGLGAMGTYFASRFLMTPGISTLAVATGSRYEQLKKKRHCGERGKVRRTADPAR